MRHFLRFAIALLALVLPFARASAQQLQCTPCNHGYWRVQIGASTQYTFLLTNTGNKTLHILSKSKKGKAFHFGKFPLPVTLNPGKSTRLTVIFKPIVTGKTTGSVTLVSDALNPKLVINVWGTGVSVQAPNLGASPSSLNFGNVAVGSSASLQLTLSASNGPVTISSAQVSSSEFTLHGLTLPLTIAAGTSATAKVVFRPNASGTASAKLTLVSDAANSPTSVPLIGVGVAAGAHSADLTWDPSNDPVIGYNVYRAGSNGGPFTQINSVLDASTSYTDSTVKSGATYFYEVTAVNAENQESGPSNKVKVVIPSP